MSSLWTPGGEHQVPRPGAGAAGGSGSPGGARRSAGPTDTFEVDTAAGADGMSEADEEAMLDEMRQMEEQLAHTPAHAVVANHCIGLFQLAVLHLQQQTPNLDDARLCIDALAALLAACHERLGPDEQVLHEALRQVQMSYVSVARREQSS